MPTLTNRERRALLVVAFIVMLSALVQWLRPHKVNTQQFDYTLQDSLFKVLSADTAHLDASELPRAALQKRHVATKSPQYDKKPKNVLRPRSIDINRATVEELTRLPRIGPKTAQAIVRYRREHGPFKTIGELDKVKRIGPKTIERIRPFLMDPE